MLRPSPLKRLDGAAAHFNTPCVRHAGLAAEAAGVRRPKHPIDYMEANGLSEGEEFEKLR